MFSCHRSTVYPRHPSQAPTCLFFFSLHLYSLQMSSQDAARLSTPIAAVSHYSSRRSWSVSSDKTALYLSQIDNWGGYECRSWFRFTVEMKGHPNEGKQRALWLQLDLKWFFPHQNCRLEICTSVHKKKKHVHINSYINSTRVDVKVIKKYDNTSLVVTSFILCLHGANQSFNLL